MPGTRKLGRTTDHRMAMLRTLVTNLLEKGKIVTTVTRAKETKALAEKIDWWIEHPAERMEMGRKYMHSVRDYDIRKSTEQIINMYKEALIS